MRKIIHSIILSLFVASTIQAQEIMDFEIDPIRTTFYMEKFQRNIQIFAFGDNPNWSAEIQLPIEVELLLAPNIHTRASIYQIENDSLIDTYFAQFPDGYIQLEIQSSPCVDSISNRSYKKSSLVHYHNTKTNEYLLLKGCAEWIPDFRLHNIWMLYQINDSIIDKVQHAAHIPRMEIHIDRMSIFGFDGCNEFRSLIDLDKNQISIKKIENLSEKICEETGIGKSFIESIGNKTFQFSVQNEMLELKSGDQKYLFKRTD